jgi:hypothetical protein
VSVCLWRCSVPLAPQVSALFVGGCEQTPSLCHRVLRLGRIPHGGQLNAMLEEVGGLMPWADYAELVNAAPALTPK